MPTFTINDEDSGGNIFGLDPQLADRDEDLVSKRNLINEQKKMNKSRWKLILFYCRFGAASVAISISLLTLGLALLIAGIYCYQKNRQGWFYLLTFSLVPLIPGVYGSFEVARVLYSESRGDAGTYMNMELLDEDEMSFAAGAKETFL